MFLYIFQYIYIYIYIYQTGIRVSKYNFRAPYFALYMGTYLYSGYIIHLYSQAAITCAISCENTCPYKNKHLTFWRASSPKPH